MSVMDLFVIQAREEGMDESEIGLLVEQASEEIEIVTCDDDLCDE